MLGAIRMHDLLRWRWGKAVRAVTLLNLTRVYKWNTANDLPKAHWLKVVITFQIVV
jgi:hypothetical protein